MIPLKRILLAFAIVLEVSLSAQQQGAGRGIQPPPQTPRQQAPVDLTGWWVSVVTEDWRWRMLTPKKGDWASVPMNDEGRKIVDAWDPGKDEREGNACKAYGAAALMRLPTRLHITWQDDATLKIETDAGTQTRLLRFVDAPVETPRSWQGRSKANWEFLGQVQNAPFAGVPGFGGGGGGGGGRGGGQAAPRYGSLKVVTDRLNAGYVRKNGVPYSENAVVTEYFDRHTENNGDVWFVVSTIVEDPKYFTGLYITSSSFKQEQDGSKWRATPCTAQ